MSIDTFISVEYKEEKQWKRIKNYHFWYNNFPDVLEKIVESRSKPTGDIVSNSEIRNRLPEDVSQETLADVPTALIPILGYLSLEVGWLLLSELILFEWDAVFRQYPLYEDTYADVVGKYFLNEVVGKLLEEYDDPDRVRLIYWVIA